jgi:hypothetical protein
MIKGMIYAQMQKFDEAIKAIDEAKAIAPESEMAARFDGLKKQLEAAKEKAKDAPKEDAKEEEEEAKEEEKE